MKFIKLLFITCITFTSCNYSGKLTKRYHSIESKNVGTSISNYISVSAFIYEKGKSTEQPKTIFELSEKGQLEFIRQLGANENNNSNLVTAIASPFVTKKTDESVGLIDYTRNTRTIVATVSDLQHFPADRVSKIKIHLKIDPAFEIISCNKLSTVYGSVELGKLNYSNTSGIELNASATGGLNVVNGLNTLREATNSNTSDNAADASKYSRTGSNTSTSSTSQGLSAKFNASRSFAEEVVLRQRNIMLNASIDATNNILTLEQEGVSGLNLTGNIDADIVFDSKKDIVTTRTYTLFEFSTGGTFNDAPALKIRDILINYFNYSTDIMADLTFEADYRHVEKRDNTSTESDDAITLCYGATTTPKRVRLLSKAQLKPKLWILIDKSDVNRKPVQLFNPSTNQNGELIFNSYENAKDFLTWLVNKSANLVANSGKIGPTGYKLLKSNGASVDSPYLQNLVVGVNE